MNFNEYIDKNLGKRVDYDGSYGFQCVDLTRDYCKEVLNTALGPSGGSAKTMWYNKAHTFNENWLKIENDVTQKDLVPSVGDIIFWVGGEYGHVAIVTKTYGEDNKVELLEQNGETGNGKGINGDAIRKKDYKYYSTTPNFLGNVKGWYSYKKDCNCEEYIEKIKELEEKIKKIGLIIK